MSQSVEPHALLLEHFKTLEDPRAEHLLEHELLDISQNRLVLGQVKVDAKSSIGYKDSEAATVPSL